MRRLILVAAVLAAAAPGFADVDVEIGNGDVVTGTLDPATETETFRVTIPAGAKLKVTVVGKPPARKQPKPPLALRVLASNDTIVAETTGVLRSKAKLTGVITPATDEYRVVVTGDGATAGNYTLKVTWKQAKRVVIPRQSLNGVLQVGFAADEGSTATMLVKAAKGSSALPRLAKVTNTGTAAETVPVPPTDAGARKHKAKAQQLPGGGDFTLDVTNAAATAGDVSGKITFKAPRPAKRKVDVTADSIGAQAGEDVARGKVIDAAGGTIVIDDAISPLLSGASIDVPVGALASPATLIVGTAPAIEPADATTEGAGPSVFFGPGGQAFATDVTVTIPFDGGDTSGLFVVERDQGGSATTVTAPLTIGSETISFAVRHFTTFRAFRPAGGGQPAPRAASDIDGDGVSDLVIRVPTENGTDGGVHIVFGPVPTSRPITAVPQATLIEGSVTGGLFGLQHPVTADLDGDDRDELLVTTAVGDGEVLIFSNVGRSQLLLDTAAVAKFFGASGDEFGTSIAAGDVNGDGTVDLVIGADGANTLTGKAYVFFGDSQAAFPFQGVLTAASADLTFLGGAQGDLLGASVHVADVTGNGSDDVVVSMDQEDRASNNPGHVLVFEGPLDGVSQTQFVAADATIDIVGENDADGFGVEIAVGDFDGNGRLDLLAAAPAHDDPGGLNLADVGAVYLFRGETLTSGGAGTVGRKFLGIAAGDGFGDTVAAGDVNADGIDDLLIGVPGDDGPAFDTGAVKVIFGNALMASIGPSTMLHGAATGDRMDIVRPPLDLNGDTSTDLIAFSPRALGTAGAVYVVFATNPFVFAADTGIDTVATGAGGSTINGVAGSFLGGDAGL